MRAAVSLAIVALALSGCVGPSDDPSNVKDLRVLAISLEKPELMADTCAALAMFQPGADGGAPAIPLLVLAPLLETVSFTALLADPNGEGRPIDYELLACAEPFDRTCSNENEWTRLACTPGMRPGEPCGATSALPGELKLDLPLLACANTEGRPTDCGDFLKPERIDRMLLKQTFDKDPVKGLGGIRVPLLLHVKAGDEEIYAQKLMVFGCKFFPTMAQNLNPQAPELLLQGEPWSSAGPLPVLQGPGPFAVEPVDFTALQESYVVPSYAIEPVSLNERWKLAWHATLGRFAPGESGGTGLDSADERHNVEWNPPAAGAEAQEVTFYTVVRDGRGGVSWTIRKAQYQP